RGARAKVMCSDDQGLRHGTDQIDFRKFHISHYGARAEDEHERDDRRGDDNRAPDITDRRARFAGQNSDIFKAAQRAEGHFAEDIQAEKGDRWRRPFDRMVLRKLARRSSEKGQSYERSISDE